MSYRSIDPATFAQAIKLLDRYEDLRPSLWQRACYWLFHLNVLVAVALLTVVSEGWWPFDHELGDASVAISVISLFVFFLLNMRLWRNVWRFRGAFRRLRLPESVQELIRGKKKSTRVAGASSWASVGTGGYFAVVAVKFQMAASDAPVQDPWAHGFFTVIFAVIIFSAFAVPYLRNGYDQLLAVSRLLADHSSAESNENIEISPADWKLFQDVEVEEINRAAALSVASARVAKSSQYGVMNSDAVNNAKASLPLDARVAVQNKIVELMREPRPDGAREIKDRNYQLPVPGSGMTLRYLVNDDRREVRVFGLDREDGST